MGLSKSFGSPNGAMRRGWNGITISRDTIHIDGIELGYKNPVFFERHAVGGEYGAGWQSVGKGTLLTNYLPDDGSAPFIVDKRDLTDDENVVVVYHNPYDNIQPLAHLFFKRCLEAELTPYIVTKKTVFKWQEGFWANMKEVFDADYKEAFEKAGLLESCGGELTHLISDAATMKLIRWTDGGFGMAAHNYDGDMLTDQIAQVHRSPGFITSNLVGKNDDGSLIKEFEASHGTVSDLWLDHLRGEETSMNPLGMVVALLDAMDHAAVLDPSCKQEINRFTGHCKEAVYAAFREGRGTRDLSGPEGLTTEQFVDSVCEDLTRRMATGEMPTPYVAPPQEEKVFSRKLSGDYKNIDEEAMKNFFDRFDTDANGTISFEEFADMTMELGIAPLKPDAKKRDKHAEQLIEQPK